MIHVGIDIDFAQFLSVLEASVLELRRNKSKISNPDSDEDIEQHAVSNSILYKWILRHSA